MRLAPVLFASCLLCACGSQAPVKESAEQQSSTSQPTNDQPGAAATDAGLGNGAGSTESPLRPGLYDVSVVETIAGVGTSPERRDRECVTSDMAAHPEAFLHPASLQGCTGTAPTRDGAEVKSELQCADNHTLSITTNLSADGWEQSVSGESENGTYESQETAQRIGDC